MSKTLLLDIQCLVSYRNEANHCRFLLPILLLRSVLNQPTTGDMEDALVSLPQNLSGAFEETITRIQRLPEARKGLGMSALMWICHAKRALTVSELSDALAVKLDRAAMSPKHRPSHKVIVECCQGLVTIDPATMSVRLVHYAIQEYLAEHSGELFHHADARLAAACLTYLLCEPFTKGPRRDKDAINSLIENNPLVSYAAEYWGVHAQKSETDSAIQQLTVTFLSHHRALACWNQILRFQKNYREIYWTPEECYSTTALHVACHFGLGSILYQLLDRGFLSVDAATKMGTTPIIKAASRGHVSIVRHLLQRGANPYLPNWYGDALHCAAEAGHSATIRELVHYGMDPNGSGYHHRIPIHCTVDRDNAAAFETLVSLGADLDAFDKNGLSIIHLAALYNAVKIIDMIVQRHLVDLETKTEDGFTAMHFAVVGNNTTILQRLVEAGADINARNDMDKTPLDYAIQHGYEDATSLLLKYGACAARQTGEVSTTNLPLRTCDVHQLHACQSFKRRMKKVEAGAVLRDD